MNVTTIGIDLAKTVFSIHGTDQHGKVRLGRITKRGDKYLRTLLIHGTRAVIAKLPDKNNRLSRWARELVERRGYKRAAVALAAKNARIIWVLLMNQTEFKSQPVEG